MSAPERPAGDGPPALDLAADAEALARVVTVDDLEALGRARLDPMVAAYYAGGAGDLVTLRDNRAAWARVRLAPRVLAGVGRVDTATTVLGAPVAMPALVAPTAFHRLAHPDGERAMARAAGAAGTVMVLSSLATVPMEEVVAAARGPVWFQLYVYRDRGLTRDLVARAEAAGCGALVLTVDSPRLGRRDDDARHGFHLPEGVQAANVLAAGHGAVGQVPGGSGLAAYFERLIDPDLRWDDLAWLAGVTRLPLLVKGVVRPDDATRAVEHGARAVVVSNHGGRQLDGAPATADALPRVVEAVAGRCEVLVDGGVRRGVDVLRALALGARAVLVGRAPLWGLAAAGEAGAARALELLRDELALAMALCGVGSAAAVGGDALWPACDRNRAE